MTSLPSIRLHILLYLPVVYLSTADLSTAGLSILYAVFHFFFFFCLSHFDHLALGRRSWSLCLSFICLLAMHTLICVTFSLPPGVGGWLRLLLVALPGLFCLPFCPPMSPDYLSTADLSTAEMVNVSKFTFSRVGLLGGQGHSQVYWLHLQTFVKHNESTISPPFVLECQSYSQFHRCS